MHPLCSQLGQIIDSHYTVHDLLRSRLARKGRSILDLFLIWFMLPDGIRIFCMIQRVLPRLDLYHADPALPLITKGEDLDDLGHGPSEF